MFLGDLGFPILLEGKLMIAKADIEKLVKEKLDDEMFIVDINVSTNNAIHVYVDGFDGMTIEKCIEISRHVEHSLDRDEEDFSLEVSSPGLTEGFKVREQYIKYTGRPVEVVNEEGKKLEGTLKVADDEGIVLETSKREKVEGHKKKQLVVRDHKFKYNEIKSAKAAISFK